MTDIRRPDEPPKLTEILIAPIPTWGAIVISIICSFIAYANTLDTNRRNDETELNHIRKELANLKEDGSINKALIDGMQSELSRLQSSRIRDLISMNSQSGEGDMDCTSDSYLTVRTPLGSLAVACEKIINHLDGYKITVAVGNLTSVGLVDPKVVITYNETEYQTGLYGKIPPGSWAYATAIVPMIPTSDLKALSVKVIPNQISLLKPR